MRVNRNTFNNFDRVMKLKSMYTCVARRPNSEEAYEHANPKAYPAKKLHKSNKKSTFKPKWQPLSKTPKTPPKSPCMIETPPPSTPIEQLPLAPKRNSPRRNPSPNSLSIKEETPPAIMDRRASPGLPSPIKPVNAVSLFNSISSTDRHNGRKNITWDPAFDQTTSPFVGENDQHATSFPQYDSVAPDDLSSQDDVFARSSPSWSSRADERAWDKSFPVSVGDSADDTVRLLKALKLSSMQQQAMEETASRCGGLDGSVSQLSAENDFEDLKNEMMKKYGFVGVNGAVTFKASPRTNNERLGSMSSSSSLVTSSVDRATASFETARAFCDSQKMSAKSNSLENRPRLGQMCSSGAAAPPLCRRAFSTSVANKGVDWSDIPPLIPPREPVRPSRHSPSRHSSTPSPTSSSQLTSSTSTTCSESVRPKYQTQSSTTTVFSAIPPRMTGSGPIILPIMKDGKQDSFTHYYLVADEKSIPKSQRPPQPKPEPLNGIARPTPSAIVPPFNRSSGPPPPRPPPPSSSMFTSSGSNIFSSGHNSSDPATSFISTHQVSTFPPRSSPTFSDSFNSSFNTQMSSVTRYNDMGPGQKVVALQSEVFGVTDEECQSALRANEWDVARSINYLKIEQLFRVGISTREICHQILRSTGWDLQSASRMLIEQHQKNRGNRS